VRTALARAGGLRRGLGRRLARDIRTGVAKRRFEVDDLPGVTLAAGGTILASIAGRLHGELGDDAPERTATTVLKLLGLPAREARRVAHRPLPPIAVPEGTAPRSNAETRT
jgi:hypothetical protein